MASLQKVATRCDDGLVTRKVIVRDRSLFDEKAQRLLAEARRALPALEHDAVEVVLPGEPTEGRCRICGRTAKLTREHIPPGAAFNKSRGTTHTLEEWLARDELGHLPGGDIQQGGIWGYTLCASCNNNTGARYANEYGLWAGTAVNMLAEAGIRVPDLDAQRELPAGEFEFSGDPGPRPGAFVRQVLAMMCAVSSEFDLAGRYPAIRRLVLEDSGEPLPEGMGVGLSLYLGPLSRIVGPMVTVIPSEDRWEWLMEIAHPPFATLMVLASNVPSVHGFDLSDFTLLPSSDRRRVRGRLPVGFGHTFAAGDYRTRAALDAASSSMPAESPSRAPTAAATKANPPDGARTPVRPES